MGNVRRDRATPKGTAIDYINHVLDEDDAVREAFDRHRARRQAVEGLIETRHACKLSQSALADRMGVNQGVVSRLESAKHSPRLETLEQAAAAMGYQLEVKWKKLSAKTRT